MDSAWPLWALPFWTMGVPLIWAVVEKLRTAKAGRQTTHFGVRPLRAASPQSLYEQPHDRVITSSVR